MKMRVFRFSCHQSTRGPSVRTGRVFTAISSRTRTAHLYGNAIAVTRFSYVLFGRIDSRSRRGVKTGIFQRGFASPFGRPSRQTSEFIYERSPPPLPRWSGLSAVASAERIPRGVFCYGFPEVLPRGLVPRIGVRRDARYGGNHKSWVFRHVSSVTRATRAEREKSKFFFIALPFISFFFFVVQPYRARDGS